MRVKKVSDEQKVVFLFIRTPLRLYYLGVQCSPEECAFKPPVHRNSTLFPRPQHCASRGGLRKSVGLTLINTASRSQELVPV